MEKNTQPPLEPSSISHLLQMLKDVNDATHPEDILHSILDLALRVAAADRAEIALWNPECGRLEIVALLGDCSPTTGKVGDLVPQGGMMMRAWKQREAEPVIARQVRPGRGYHSVDRRTRAEAVFRLQRRGAKFGLLNLEWFRQDMPHDSHIELLRLLVEHATLAMRMVGQTNLFANLANGLSVAHQPAEAVCRVLEGIRKTYGFDRALVFTSDVGRRVLEARFILTGQKAREVKRSPWSYSFDERSLAVHTYNTGEPCFVDDPYHRRHSGYMNGKGLRVFRIDTPLVAFPLIFCGKQLGAIVLWTDQGPQISKTDTHVLKPVADLVAAYLGQEGAAETSSIHLDLLRNILLESQASISKDEAICAILKAVQAFGFDRARYLRFDAASRRFVRDNQFAMAEVPRREHVPTKTASKYTRHLIRTFAANPDSRVYDPVIRGQIYGIQTFHYGIDPDYKRLGKSRDTPWLAVPVSLQGQLIGQIAADNETSKRPIPPEAGPFLTLVAGVTALVLSRLSEIDFSLINALPIAMFRKNLEGEFLSVNERFASDAGMTVEEVKGKRDHDIYRTDIAAKFRQDDQWVMTNKKIGDWVEENVTRERKTCVHVVKAPLFDAARKVIGVQGLYMDEPYRAIFENSTEGIYQSYPDGRYKDVNTAWARLLGYTREELLDPKSKLNIARDVYAYPGDRDYFRKKIKHNKGHINFEYYIRRRDRSLVKVAEYAWEVRDRDNNLLYYEGIVRDISSQIKQSAVVTKAQSKGLAGPVGMKIAHEVGNFLECLGTDANILGLQIKKSGLGQDPKYRAISARITNGLTNIMRHVKASGVVLERYKCGEPTAIYAPAIVDDAIHFAHKLMNLMARRSGVRCELSLRTPKARIEMSEVEFIQVFVNLIKNSIEATERGGKAGSTVRVRTRLLKRQARKAPDRVLIEYEDSAGGMSKVKLHSLFQRARLNDEERDRGPGGHGTGMLVVSKIIDGNGGTIAATSEPGKGTTFSIILPLH